MTRELDHAVMLNRKQDYSHSRDKALATQSLHLWFLSELAQ